MHRNGEELTNKVYETQKIAQTKGDWYEISEIEKLNYEITLTDQEISKMSRNKFKKLVEKKIHTSAISYLQELAGKHSKSTKIAKEKFGKKAYLKDKRFSKEDCQLLFALKTKMVDCKTNFSHLYEENMTCRICFEADSREDEDHILLCKTLNDTEYDVSYCDVYADIDKQYKVTQIFKKVLRKRNVYIEAMRM